MSSQFAQRVGAYYFTQIALAAARDPAIDAKLFEVINLNILPNGLIGDARILFRVFLARLLVLE